jgi:hypothetical protein
MVALQGNSVDVWQTPLLAWGTQQHELSSTPALYASGLVSSAWKSRGHPVLVRGENGMDYFRSIEGLLNIKTDSVG